MSSVLSAEAIANEHDRLGMTLGWRFLMCPEARLRDAEVAVVTLNPGGTRRVDTEWSQERGNAYYIEGWSGQAPGQDKLQAQVQKLVTSLGVGRGSVLAGCFIPFRSPDFARLPRQQEAIGFARRLWSEAVEQCPARLYICVGKRVVGRELAAILGAHPITPVALGWGEQTIERHQAADGRRVVAFPHFSRFPPFSSTTRTSAVITANSDWP